MKNAIKQEQSQSRLDYAERFCPPITGEPKGVQRPLKHFGRSQS